MLAVDFGDIICNLERGTDFIRRQEGITAQRCQTVDSEGGKSAIFRQLGYAHDAAIGERKVAEIIGCGRNARGVKVAQTRTSFVNQGRRNRIDRKSTRLNSSHSQIS